MSKFILYWFIIWLMMINLLLQQMGTGLDEE